MGGGVVVSRRRHYSVTGGTHSLLSRVDAWAASQSPSKLSPAATGPQIFAAYRAAHDRRRPAPRKAVDS